MVCQLAGPLARWLVARSVERSIGPLVGLLVKGLAGKKRRQMFFCNLSEGQSREEKKPDVFLQVELVINGEYCNCLSQVKFLLLI